MIRKPVKNILVSAICAALADPVASQVLEEVVVTARKKVESIQDVPVAVSAIAGSDVEQAFTLDTTSLQAFAPNVVLDTIEVGTPGGGGFSIRGISYQDVDKGFDPTVLVAVDDVPLATGTGQVFDMIDIERIEILRGPQGTLFGKNVVGGLINIHRVKPQLDDVSGKARFRAGQYDKASGDFLLNYGEESWAVKVTGGMERQGEGYVDMESGGDTWNRDVDRFGGHLLWQPNDVFTGEVMFDYSNLEGSPGGLFSTNIDSKDVFCALTQQFDSMGIAPGGTYCSGAAGESATGDRETVAADYQSSNKLEKYQLTTRLVANITDDHSITYIGSIMKSDDKQVMDSDGTPYPIYHWQRWGDFDQISNEVRLSRDSGSNFTWQLGFFQAQAEGTLNQDTILTLLGCDLGGAPCTYDFARTSSDSYSVYGEGDLSFLDDSLVFTLGARYINETKKLSRDVFNYPTAQYELGPNAGGTREDSDVIYRIGARYHFNDDIMAYVTTSTGFRSGGLSPRAQTADVLNKGYEPESLTNYEIGLRTTLLEGGLIFNLTAFHMDYEDMQIELAVPSVDEAGNTVGTGTQLAVENAGKATIRGFEFDFQWAVTDWWRLSGNAGFLDTEYDELFVNIWGDLDSNGILLPAEDETDLDLRRAPEWSYGLSSTMNWDVGDGRVTWRTAYSWTDSYEATITNYYGSSIEDTGILEISISYDVDSWRLSLFGRNLTDEDSWTHNYAVNPVRPTATDPAPGSLWRFAQRRAPREIGAELIYRF